MLEIKVTFEYCVRGNVIYQNKNKNVSALEAQDL